MRQSILCFVAILCILSKTYGQDASIRGSVLDTANQKKLQYAVITLLNPADSSIITFTRTDKEGRFILPAHSPGKFSVMISYPSFADYVDEVQLQPGAVVDLGTISLTNKSVLLKEIIIRQNNAMRLKGDTIEYTADSFKVRANASAEELLKAMPGIQVDKDGKIIAQGQEVQKVLVDGEEFFSDDPTVATRNIRADAVDKVQVFDKKSDQAAFTGIDDGEKTKTINLKLKEDKKNGYFGKVSAGGGLKDKFNNEAMVNFFKGKRKVAAFGTMSNTGQTGLNWQDSRKYGASEDNFEYDENSGFFYSFAQNDAFDFNGNGLPKVWTGGLHFSNKWNEDKHNFNASYMYKKLDVAGVGETQTQYILPDTLYYINQRNTNFSQRDRNTLNGKYEVQLDSSSSLKFVFSGYKGRTETSSIFYSEALNENSGPVNTSNRKTTNKNQESSLNTNIIYRKKFKKTGRTITATMEQKYTDNDSQGYLDAVNNFYGDAGEIFQNDTINQRKYNHSKLFTFNGKATYTEPIGNNNYVILNYGISNTTSSADRSTYDYNDGKYDVLNPLLTNDYDFLVTTNAGGIAYRIAKKKYNLSFGSDLASQAYTQKDNLKDSSFHYNRLNLFPKASFSYIFKPQTRLNFSYNGSTQQPTIQQIQPVQENNDPLNVFTGNPDLEPAFNHRFNIFFNDYKVLKQRGFFANASFNLINNAITTSNTIDKFGKRIYQSVNSSGTYNYYSYISYNMEVPSIKTRFFANINTYGGKGINFVNLEKNITHNNTYAAGIGGYFSRENKMGINLRTNASYNTSVSSINEAVQTKYWVYSYNIDTYFALPYKFDLSSNADFNFRQKTNVFDQNRNTIIWNASLSKRLFKETCSLKFSVNDILDQNIGFRRDIQSNFITENTYATLRRFWMVSFTWNFSKNNAQTQNP
ncbi:TonB-dependent receptor [Agriterribacter sp.]|uniref:TonB-dependent receptor n=1 Tax=Agriterribacter sp. TaxID=2821509 RepID=UPI002CA8CECC|nr:TonB-dependent receptor [Agriterribacter sp.]HRP54971.1 TonB-dependent receptor [Agriterribacter sp.]